MIDDDTYKTYVDFSSYLRPDITKNSTPEDVNLVLLDLVDRAVREFGPHTREGERFARDANKVLDALNIKRRS
jgi:hypothetical protein